MKRGIEIRAMQIDDLGDVYRLGTGLYEIPSRSLHLWDKNVLAEVLSEHLPFSFVAARKKMIYAFLIGRITGIKSKAEAEILWLGVSKPDQNNAIRNALIEKFIHSLENLNVHRVTVLVPEREKEIISIFKKIGFTIQDHILDLELILPK